MRSDELIARTASLPPHEAERLLAAATGMTRTDLLLGVDLDPNQVREFADLVERRVGGEPLQYIEGWIPFGPVEIGVDGRVLVPRPETEYLLEIIVSMVNRRDGEPSVIVDLCTGSGNLALAFKSTFPGAEVYATDLSSDALAVAEANAQRNGLDIHLLHGDLFSPLPEDIRGKVDVLVANPPYLAESELAGLPADVRREPVAALVSGPRGDEAVRSVAEGLAVWLAPGGVFGVEVSEFHADEVVAFFDGVDCAVEQDLTGRDRFVIGRSHLG